MKRWLKKRKNQRGQGMTEYIIIVAVIALLSMAVVLKFGNQIRELFYKSGETLASGDPDDLDVESKMDQGDVDKTGWND